MNLLYSIIRSQHQARIHDLEANARKGRWTRRRQGRRLRELERQVDELRLVSLALFELLTERTPVTNEELIARIEAIDLRDGAADGRVDGPDERPRCPTCNRVLLQSLPQCLYCGPREEGDDDAGDESS